MLKYTNWKKTVDSWLQLARVLLDKLLGGLPRWLLRKVYPPTRLSEHIELDLRSIRPVSVSIGNTPRVSVTLRVTNKSPYVDVELEHATIEIWDNQPFIKFENNEKRAIPRWQTAQPYYDCFLNEIQRERLRVVKEKEANLQVSIYVSFNTSLGRIQKSITGVSGFKVDFTN